MSAGRKDTEERIPSPLALPLLVSFYDMLGTLWLQFYVQPLGKVGNAWSGSSVNAVSSMIASASKYTLTACLDTRFIEARKPLHRVKVYSQGRGMNLQIINGCAGTDPGLPTAVTDPGRQYLKYLIVFR